MSTIDIDDGDRADEPAYEWYDADWPTPATPKWLAEWEAAIEAVVDRGPGGGLLAGVTPQMAARYLNDPQRCMPSERARILAGFTDLDPDDKPAPPPEPKPLPANALRHRPGWEQS